MKTRFKCAVTGFLSGLALLGFYFLTLILVSGWDFTKVQFFRNWYWIIGLSLGFGAQISLLTYLKELHNLASAKITAASGTASGLAMIACCSHYLANIIPIIGISGFTAIIGQYQTGIFIVGAVSNLIGIAYLIGTIIKFSKIHES